MGDYVDELRASWASIRPGLSTEPAAVVGRISRLARIIQVKTDELLATHGMTRWEFDLLSALVRSGKPMTPTALAQSLWVSGPGTTKRLNSLEAAGLVERRPHATDARATLVSPTPAAERSVDLVLEALLTFEETLLGPTSEGERRELGTGLRRLLLHLEGEQQDGGDQLRN